MRAVKNEQASIIEWMGGTLFFNGQTLKQIQKTSKIEALELSKQIFEECDPALIWHWEGQQSQQHEPLYLTALVLFFW